jgi:hypothetical protein
MDLLNLIIDNLSSNDTFKCLSLFQESSILALLPYYLKKYNYGVNDAAYSGHLYIIKWFHNNNYNFDTNAMDFAAYNGNLAVIKWLHEHRTEGCT